MRCLSKDFISELKTGLLKPILDLVKLDSTLCLEIRDNYLNIYYRGGNIIKIEEKKGLFKSSFDRKYLDENQTKVPGLPEILDKKEEALVWVSNIPFLKHEMDLWFGSHPKNEREFQQLMLRENNFDASAKGTDYFICDIEYANHIGRFDLVAVKWPSTSQDRKDAKNLRLAFIEMKYLDNALRGSSGLCKHVEDINTFLSEKEHLDDLKNEMRVVFNQKLELGLVNNQKSIGSFSNDKPEFILALINHDPASSILKDELNKLPDSPNADIKVAVSNFMGYGLYTENIHSLTDFLNQYGRNI